MYVANWENNVLYIIYYVYGIYKAPSGAFFVYNLSLDFNTFVYYY